MSSTKIHNRDAVEIAEGDLVRIRTRRIHALGQVTHVSDDEAMVLILTGLNERNHLSLPLSTMSPVIV